MRLLAPTLCTIVLAACSTAVYGPKIHAPTDVPPPAAVHGGALKAHLNSGELVVFDTWRQIDSAIAGHGVRYGVQRQLLGAGELTLPLDSIALLESEVRVGSRPNAVVGMAVWTVMWGVVTIACVADPKSCFGSCPTFYVATDSGEALAAEGFSASIARVLEAEDLDALFVGAVQSGPFVVRMRNEALETHAIRRLELLAVARPTSGRVLATPHGRLVPATTLRAPVACLAEEGDCLPALAALDGVQRLSPADSTDLATRETLELTFPAARGRLGLVIAARQSLMSTYLFYETMGFLGGNAGETLAALERGGRAMAQHAMGMADLIAPIEVAVADEHGWRPIGVHDEAGPLATQVVVLPFAHQVAGPVRIRVTASRGAWRLDWLALADLGDPVEPIVLSPVALRRDGVADSVALAHVLDPEAHLITYPGDTYDVAFALPPTAAEWDVFLRSEGYYYEWMRSEWLADENPALATLALTQPAAALRVLAPGFKRAEASMEQRFWSSRFRR